MMHRRCIHPWSAVACALFLFACSNDSEADGQEETGDGVETTDGGGDGDGDGDGDGENPTEAPGCDGAALLERPADLSAPGPWQVGARTLTVAGRVAEVWYPASLEVDGFEAKQYDPRIKLPPSQQGLISDEQTPFQICDCGDELPLDSDHGPYPVIVYVHGTAAWATVSLTQMTHWASRGFVVVAMDHPGLFLGDMLSIACPDEATGSQDLSGDVDALLAALSAGTDGFAFVEPYVDMTRVGVIGHSAGGGAVAGFGGKSGVRAIVPMASGGAVTDPAMTESTLFMGALSDTVVSYDSTKSAYQSTVTNKHLIGIENTGHLVFSDICELQNSEGKDILQIAEEVGICGAQFAGVLFDCNPSFLDPGVAKDIINDASSAVFEGVLMCSDAEATLKDIQDRYPDVSEYLGESP